MNIIWQDILLLSAIVLYAGTGVMTRYVYFTTAKLTEHAEYVESNPQARQLLDMRYGIVVAQVIVVGILLGCYASARASRLDSLATMYIFNSLTFAVAWLFVWNFLNDLPVFIKVVMGK